MRWFCLSLLLVVLGLALIVSGSRPSAAQNKQLSTFEVQILAEHNNVRQKYTVQLMSWDDSLAALAQEWANKIAADGVLPPPHREGPYGENFSWGTAGALDPKGVLERWGNEGQNYDRTTNTCAPGKTCVHFTQVVWSTTTRVGCGKARSTDGQTDFVVCNYSPSGNHVGQSPFPTSLTPTQTATLTPTETPAPQPTPTPRPVARQITSAATPIPAPTPVTRLVTSAPTPTPAANPNANAECDVCKNVQQLTAQVEQLRQRIGESPKPATPKAGTSLLFAFATNQLGYDTGIAISNTSLDTGTGLGATAMQGVCTLNYYCGQTGCTSPPAQTTNAAIPAGQQLTFTLSGGGNYGIAATPGISRVHHRSMPI